MITKIFTKPKVVIENGKPSEVIIKWSDFKELLERIEDSYDLAEVRKIKSQKHPFRYFSALKEKYGL